MRVGVSVGNDARLGVRVGRCVCIGVGRMLGDLATLGSRVGKFVCERVGRMLGRDVGTGALVGVPGLSIHVLLLPQINPLWQS